MERPTRLSPGWIVIAIGLLHTLVGLLMAHGVLVDIARDGLVGAVEPDPGRQIAFWFFFFGFALLLFGQAVRVVERYGPVPTGLGVGLAVMCLLGGLSIPLSGFWLGLVPAFLILQRSGRASSETAQTNPRTVSSLP